MGVAIRRPIFEPMAILGSRAPITTLVVEDHREFLRITLVTDRISEWRTCLREEGLGRDEDAMTVQDALQRP